jgi:tRNA(Arg) A34 adenosine deaminase TadA
MRWAWIESEAFADGPKTLLAVGLPDGAGSAVAALIESVHETESRREPSRARMILRERIHSSEPATITELELVKVAAKRMSAPSPLDPRLNGTGFLPPLLPPRSLPDFAAATPPPEAPIDERAIRARLELLRAEGVRAANRWSSDRPVSAMLVDTGGRVLAEAWNSNAVIRNRHAEWNLCEILRARGERIPAGSTLWTTLKPCRMCAARIWESAEDPRALDVAYLEDDPGALARGTLLDEGSPARLRAFGKDSPLFDVRVQRGPLDEA